MATRFYQSEVTDRNYNKAHDLIFKYNWIPTIACSQADVTPKSLRKEARKRNDYSMIEKLDNSYVPVTHKFQKTASEVNI